jgi:SAM-dependent methyltransferase
MATSSAYDAIDWYDTPLYYDIIFDRGTRAERDFLMACHQKFGLDPALTVLEPACGSGRLVQSLAEAGYTAYGFDANAAMVQFARQRLHNANLQGHLFEGRMERFEAPCKVALAHCLVSTFKYLQTEADAVSHLALMAESLTPGGIYVLGFHLTDYQDTCRSRERWCEARGKTLVTCNIQTWPANARSRLEQVRSRLIVRQGRTCKKSETVWQFRTYNARQVRALLAQVPALQHVATFDFGYDLSAPRALDDNQLDVVLVLRRRP